MRRIVALLAVLGFAMRSLVPVGFMWEAVDGRNSVVACSEYPGDVIAHDAHYPHHHHSGDSRGGSFTSTHGCPFALAGAAALASQAQATLAPHFQIVRVSLPTFESRAPASIPVRFLAPRGPPAAS